MSQIRGLAARSSTAAASLLTVLVVALVLTAAALANHPGPPSGSGVEPVFTPGNPTCADLDPGTFELRINNPSDGTFTDGTLTVTLDVRDTADGPVLDWSSTIGVDSIFVKGGPNGNFYRYDPPAEATSDKGLHSPVNHQNGKFFGLSHVSFCYDILPSIKVDKTGDELSKVGDTVTYDFRITNDGDITLSLGSVSDSLLGDLTATASAGGCGTLAAGASCSFSVDRTVEAGDPDPLPNTVTVNYSGTLPDGSSATVTDSDDHSVNLFQPSVTIDKTGDALSKIGDPVDYTITVTNTSSNDSPNLTCTISDPTVGLSKSVNLASGAVDVTNVVDFVIPDGAADPFVNTASVDCTVDGFGNVLATQSDSHSVNLFQPSVKVDKTGPIEAFEGDTITYSYTITNTSSDDSPSLILETVSDNVVGDLTAAATANGCGTLAPGASCTFTADFTIPVGTPSPLVNVVTVDYHPDGFANEVKDDDDHSVEVKRRADEGCTPGFWKTHPESWGPTGFSPDQTLEDVFDVPDAFGLDDRTLLEALSFNGGSGAIGAARILLRAGVAALLNASHPDVSFPRSPADVIADVNAALSSGDRRMMLALAAELDADNNLGCPLGQEAAS